MNEAIILAGGLGTRLRRAVPDLPKCMAPVAGRPFLFYVINQLRREGIEKFIFSLGYKHEIIEEYLNTHFPTLNFQYSIEEEPLGTGGAIRLACQKTSQKDLLIANGDTLFKANLAELFSFHLKSGAACSLALKPMQHFDRYGAVKLNKDYFVSSFREKQYYPSGLINGGLYALNVKDFLNSGISEKFSFEKDFLERECLEGKIAGLIQDAYFIDIGIPEDFQRSQQEFSRPPLDLKKIDKSWTIFLDRDGVINREIKDDYVKSWNEFHFYDEAEEAIRLLSKKFGRVFVVSNQRGIGRNIMSEEDLLVIHRRMKEKIKKAGGQIDHIYYCGSIDDKNPCRKPNPGMAFQAKNDYPEINLSKSIMAGNKLSDMQFGRNAGIYTIFIKTTDPFQSLPHPDIDLDYFSLIDFAKNL